MFPNKSVECGLQYRKYLYIIGALAVFGLMGSYWYLNYFLDEIGIDSEKALATTRDIGQRGVQAIAELPGTPIQMAPPGFQVPPPNTPMAQPNRDGQNAGFLWPQQKPQGMWGLGSMGAPTDPESFPTVVRSILPSVVNVSTQNRSVSTPVAMTTQAAPPQMGPQQPINAPAPASPEGLKFASPFSGVAMESIGSGVIVSADGYIVSNFHVVENSQNVFVTVFGAQGVQRYPADVIRLDPARDLVLLKINVPMPLQPAPLGNSDLIQVGDPVITVGCPFGLDQTVSKGIVSGSRKAVTIEGTVHKDLIQTDAAINQGNSGGPLVSRYGYVIGINTAIYSPTQAFSGVGFAVPVNSVREFVSELITIPDVTPAMMQPGWLGQGRAVAATTTRPAGPPPIPANAVAPHGDRGRCENCHVILRSGQLINQTTTPGGANGINVALPVDSAMMANTQPSLSPATPQALATPQMSATPATPATTTIALINGAEFKPLDSVIVKRFQPPYSAGVFVQNIQPGSMAETGGLQTGDIIFKVNGRWVRHPEELQQRLNTIAVGDKARLSIVRKRQRMEVGITITPPPVNLAQPMVTPPTPTMATTATVPPGGKPAKTTPPVPTEFEWFGMELQPIQPAMITKNPALKNKQGAVVQETDPGLQADTAGIRANDIVVAINSLPVGSNAELDKAIKSVATAKTILLDVERDGKRMFVTLQ
ncbi:MAG: trypsin-like peptidase domain-containing protein [Magnetococcales bacterium]|nr:trypsin-like peptidase domain-containing protein [Magnetococcales bacterium]